MPTGINLNDLEELGADVERFDSNQYTQSGMDYAGFPIIDVVWQVVSILFTVAVYGFMLAILVGGVRYVFAMGSDEASEKGKKSIINATIGLVIVFFSYQAINLIVSQFGGTVGSGNFTVLIAQIYQILVLVAGAGFLVMLVTAGLTYMVAQSDEGTTKARKQIINAFIGIILVAGAFLIGRAVLLLLQIPVKI